MDVIHLHLVQDIDGVAVGGVMKGLRTTSNHAVSAAALLVEKDGANIGNSVVFPVCGSRPL